MGVKAVEELGKENLPAQIELFDAGTAFPTLFYQLLGFDKLIIIDAITGNGPAGTVYRLELDEVMGNPDAPLTLHELTAQETPRTETPPPALRTSHFPPCPSPSSTLPICGC